MSNNECPSVSAKISLINHICHIGSRKLSCLPARQERWTLDVRYWALTFLVLASTTLIAHPGVGIVEDSKGNIYYTDLTHVWQISPEGKKTKVVPNVHTHELYMDEHDNLFGEHLWYNGDQRKTWGYYVWKKSADGKIDKIIPDTEGFRENYSFVQDHFGNMFLADRTEKCQKVVRRNGIQHSIASEACFQNIRWMNATADGHVYVVDFQDVKKIDSKGNVQTIATQIADKKVKQSTIENQNAVMGIWDDANGNIYTAVTSLRQVKKFLPDGREEIALKTNFPWSPSGGMVDHVGRLWVLESNVVNQVRVERVDSQGTRIVY